MIYLYFDGSTQTNPGGPGGWAYVLTDDCDRLLKADCGDLEAGPQCTNNTCEWHALLFGLIELARDPGRWDEVTVRGDSQLVVNQAKGKYKAKKAHLLVLADRAKELIKKVGRHRFEFEWLARDKNKLCDSLSRQSTRPYTLPIGTWDLPGSHAAVIRSQVAQDRISEPISPQGDLYATCDSSKPRLTPQVALAVDFLTQLADIEMGLKGGKTALYWDLYAAIQRHAGGK